MNRRGDDQKIIEQAAEWFVALRDTDELTDSERRRQRQAFLGWLEQSQVHVHEYLMITRLWGDVAEVEVPQRLMAGTAAIKEASGAALPVPGSAEAGTDKPVTEDKSGQRAVDELEDGASPLVAAIAARNADAGASASRKFFPYALAAGLVLVAGLLVVFAGLYLRQAPVVEYATVLGEQRAISLADGSTVRLNTRTAIRVQLQADQRRVQLLSGEALFEVAPDAGRPFIVETGVPAGPAFVRVLGTRFNVYRQSGRTEVTVLEGTVLVAPRAYDGQPPATGAVGGDATVRMGQQAVIAAVETAQADGKSTSARIGVQVTDDADLDRAVAWTEQRLIFDGEPLSAIVEEFNRYNSEQLAIASPTLANLPLSGIFTSNDPEALVTYLRHIRQIRVETGPDGSQVIYEQSP